MTPCLVETGAYMKGREHLGPSCQCRKLYQMHDIKQFHVFTPLYISLYIWFTSCMVCSPSCWGCGTARGWAHPPVPTELITVGLVTGTGSVQQEPELGLLETRTSALSGI